MHCTGFHRRVFRGVLVGLAGVLFSVCVSAQKKNAPPAAPAALTVTAAQVRAIEIPRTVTANGSIHAWQEVIIGPEVGGYRVARVNVDVGDRVRRGQELVRLSADMLDAEVSSKRAALKRAEAQLVIAQAAHRRALSVVSSGVYSTADQERLQSEELAAKANVDAAQADLHAAELRLQYTRVRAPDDGVITSREVTVGQIAQAGTEMLRLLRQSRIEWRAEIPEARLREIKVGQLVQLRTADGGQLLGKVRTVAPTVETQRRTGIVYVDIDSQGSAKPGMFARGEIEVSRSKANLVPLMSVVVQDGYSYVFVLNGTNSVSRRRVQTGIVRGNDVEIVSGVRMGEHLAEKGAGFLKDGDRVIVARSEAPPAAGAPIEQAQNLKAPAAQAPR
jgi:RND family efflux transporter MFP subunit